MSSYEYTLNLYLEIVDNKEKRNERNKLETELFVEINTFKKMISDYEKSQDVQFVSDAVDFYINTILPNADKLRNLKYSYSHVEYDESDDTYHLIQKPITLEQLEWDLGETPQGIITMKMGMDKFKLRKEKPDEKAPAIPLLRKTAAPAKKLVLEESSSESEEEESEEEEESDEEKPLPKLTIEPKLLEDGRIAASEASRLNWKIAMVNGELTATNPTSGKTYGARAGV